MMNSNARVWCIPARQTARATCGIRYTFAIVVLACFKPIALSAQVPSLSVDAAQQRVLEVYADLAKSRSLSTTKTDKGFESFAVTAADVTMNCVGKLFGAAEAGKRSLFISMHGGGGAPAKVNEQQWKNQIQLYQPAEGYYVAPRAPTNTWNLWHQPHVDVLLKTMAEDFVATKGVDPDRIYLMGYSAGGDGVFQLAPRMADHFAAATMMAGHPNSVSPDGLFNLPFRIYMGGKDAAYKRNELAHQWKTKLADLQSEHGGYPHRVTIYPDLGHWMKLRDAEAVPWMAKQTRDPWPKKVIWGETENRAKRFYWLGGISTGTVTATVQDQVVSVSGVGDQSITLYLHDQLIDLDLPVTVVVDGTQVQSALVKRSDEAIRSSLSQRLDPAMAATAIIRLNGRQ